MNTILGFVGTLLLLLVVVAVRGWQKVKRELGKMDDNNDYDTWI